MQNYKAGGKKAEAPYTAVRDRSHDDIEDRKDTLVMDDSSFDLRRGTAEPQREVFAQNDNLKNSNSS